MHYEDFVIQIGRDDGDGHRLRVLDSPAGQGTGFLRLPPDIVTAQLARAGAQTKTRRATPGTRHLVPPPPTTTTAPSASNAAVGEALFEALFSGQVRSLYDQSLGTLRGQSKSGLRIKLKLDPKVPNSGQLQALPWELLRRADTQEYLSLSRFSPVVRYLDVPRPPDALPLPTPLRLLVVISNPNDLDELDVSREQKQLAGLGRAGLLEVMFIEAARPSALRRALVEHEIHMLHFIGHGGFNPDSGEGVLYLVGPEGGALPMSGATLATILCDVPTLRLAVLNACESARAGRQDTHPFAGVANALVLGGLPAVVAMQAPISDDAAIVFSEAFYRQLTTGTPIDTALTEGRQAVHFATPDSSEWSTPILFLRIPNGELFQPAATVEEPIVEPVAEPVPEPGGPRRGRWMLALALILVSLFSLGTWRWLTLNDQGVAVTEQAALQPATREEPPTKEPEPQSSKSSAPVRQSESPPVVEPLAPKVQPARSPAPDGDSVLPAPESFKSSAQGFRGQLVDVVQMPNKLLCWKFELHNGSSSLVNAGFDLEKSYLADNQGARYPIVRADTSTGIQPVIDAFGPGTQRGYWMVFDPPIGGEQNFIAFLRSAKRGVSFDAFRVKLADKVSVDAKVAPGPQVPEGALPLAVNVPAIGVRGTKGLEANVSAVMLFAADINAGRRQSRMRWVLTLHNTTFDSIEVGLALPAIHLEDEYGNIYSVLASSAGQRPAEGLYIQDLEAGLRSEPWFEFPAPRPGVRRLKARFANHEPSRLQFDEIAVDLPEIADTYRYTPATLAFAAEGGGNFGTSLGSLEARLVEVERLENGRLRWQIELRNESGEAIDVGFDFAKVHLADGSRNYRLQGSDTGMRKDQIYVETIPAGGKVFHWFDFTEPPASSTAFNLMLASHDGSFHYRPLSVELN